MGPSSNHAENGEGAGESDIKSEGVGRGYFPSSNSPYDIQQFSNGVMVVEENTPYPWTSLPDRFLTLFKMDI
jgi:hypothetical protein